MKKAVRLFIFIAIVSAMAACTNRTGDQNTSPSPTGAVSVTPAPTLTVTEAPTPAATTAPTGATDSDVTPTGTATNP